MLKIPKLFVVGLLIISCNSNSQKHMMTVKEFTRIYLDSLSVRFPTAKFNIVDDSTIESNFQNKVTRTSVDNAFKDYLSEPDSLQRILSNSVSVASELYNPMGKINVDRIIPIIKPIEYLDDIRNVAKKMGASKDVEGVYEKYNDQLIIVYAEDTKSNIRYLTHDDLKTLSINPDSLKKIAAGNLEKLLTSIKIKGGKGVYMLMAGGDYEASIILLDNVFTKESLPVNGNFVIAIPNRDMLLITGSNDKDGISKIHELAQKSYSTGSYQVSDYLYKWNGKAFEKYE